MPRGKTQFGYNAWDFARESFRACPRCGAAAKVLHIDPMFYADQGDHSHRCTRCRHEWLSTIEDHENCPYEHCTGQEYLDATTASILNEIKPQYLLDRDQLGLSNEFRPLSQKLAIVRIAALLREMFGNDSPAIGDWLSAPVHELNACPAELITRPYGLQKIQRFLETYPATQRQS